MQSSISTWSGESTKSDGTNHLTNPRATHFQRGAKRLGKDDPAINWMDFHSPYLRKKRPLLE